MRTKRKCMTGLPSEGRASGRSCHCELFSMLDGPVSWLPGHPPRAPFPLYAVGILRIKARFVSGYSGGGPARDTPALPFPPPTHNEEKKGARGEYRQVLRLDRNPAASPCRHELC